VFSSIICLIFAWRSCTWLPEFARSCYIWSKRFFISNLSLAISSFNFYSRSAESRFVCFKLVSPSAINYFSFWISACLSCKSFSLFCFWVVSCVLRFTISCSSFLFYSCEEISSPWSFRILSSASARFFYVAASYLLSSPDSWPPYDISSCNRLISISRPLIASSR
jgi:hypothetical protein